MKITEKVLLIRPAKLYHEGISQQALLEATRGVCRLGTRRHQADYAFTVIQGVVKEVYRINAWLHAGTLKYETRLKSEIDIPDRWEFDGEIDTSEIRDRYVGASVKEYLPHGASNPIIYINC